MIAEGGTDYHHSVTIARSKNITDLMRAAEEILFLPIDT
jgi:beta-xylosidase